MTISQSGRLRKRQMERAVRQSDRVKNQNGKSISRVTWVKDKGKGRVTAQRAEGMGKRAE